MKISSLTIAELKAKQAQLELKAEQERARWRGLVATSPHALAAGRRVNDLDHRASDYRLVLSLVLMHEKETES